jgi:hypothetical protein
MRIKPLVLHGAARIPALTDLFSTSIEVDQMTVVVADEASVEFADFPDSFVSIDTTDPHGVAVGEFTSLSVVDANVPNHITTAVVNDDGSITLTTQYQHDLTMSPPGSSLKDWNSLARLVGFSSQYLLGLIQLVEVIDRNKFRVLPSHEIASIILTGQEALLERLEDGVIGWHKVQAVSTTRLTFPVPEDVISSYIVPSPKVVNNIRIAGALSLDVARTLFTRGYKPGSTTQDDASNAEAWLFICPAMSIRLSKDRKAQSDSVAEITPYADYRQLLLDGFQVYAFIPADKSHGAVGPNDLAHGEILTAVLRTFHGLTLPRKELYQADTFIAIMMEHGNALGEYDYATYIHGYLFEAPAYLTQFDAIQTFEWSRIDETTMQVASGLGPGAPGGVVNEGTGSVVPSGSFSFRDLEFGPQEEGGGIFNSEQPQPLTAIVKLT